MKTKSKPNPEILIKHIAWIIGRLRKVAEFTATDFGEKELAGVITKIADDLERGPTAYLRSHASD